MDKRKRNEELLIRIDEITQILWKNQGDGNKAIVSCVKQVNEVLKEFFARISEFQGYGVDIPQDVLLTQLRNLMNGFEQRDMVLLADTLEYEVKNKVFNCTSTNDFFRYY